MILSSKHPVHSNGLKEFTMIKLNNSGNFLFYLETLFSASGKSTIKQSVTENKLVCMNLELLTMLVISFLWIKDQPPDNSLKILYLEESQSKLKHKKKSKT